MKGAEQLLRRALEHLEWCNEERYNEDLEADIRTYLANQETAKDEAVAWLHCQGNYEEPSFRQLTDEEIKRAWTQKPLYLHSAKPERKPMTEEEMREFFKKDLCGDGDVAFFTFRHGIRHAEKHHGIGEKDE